MPDPVLVELLRRGDLTLTRSTVTNNVGLLRDEFGVPAAPAVTFDPGEWRWLVHCAAPVALRELAAIEADAEAAGRAPAQATLAFDA
jgi:hypothetical protein